VTTITTSDDATLIREIRNLRGYRALAEWLVARIGGSINESRTTESVYVRTPWGPEIRLSGHTSYGSIQPLHVRRGTGAETLNRLRMATVAAQRGLRNYQHVAQVAQDANAAAGRGKWDAAGLVEAAGF